MVKISIVIPCRNEAPYIEECVKAIFNSEIDSDLQISVFITDGMSNDGTREIIQELQQTFAGLFLIDNVKQVTPFAFNLGIHAQEFDFLQIIGARHIVSNNYIQNCYNKLKTDNDTWCVGGRLINEYINDSGKIIANAMSTTFGMGLGNFRTLEKSGFTDTVTSPMYPKHVFEKIGYFDEELIRNQDDDFNFRVIKAGGKIFFDADISLKYYVRGNFKGLWKQFFQYGYWKVYVNKKHKAVTTFRQLIPPLFVLFLLVFPFTLFISKWLFLTSTLFLAIYLVLALYFSVKIKLKQESLNFIKILGTFPMLHLSYGLGYLKGILEFLMLNRKPSDKQKELSR